LLRKGINEGIFRKDINLDIIVKIILAQMKLLVDNEVFSSDKYSLTDVFKNMVINFIRGIATNKGIELIDSLES